jgi:Sulfotransferase family
LHIGCYRYVIKEARRNQFDHHWSPYDKLCHFCHIKYDFVAKLETMDADSYRLVSHFGLDHKDPAGVRNRVPKFNSRQHRLPATTSDDATSSRPPASSLFSKQLMEFDTLTAAEMDALKDIYAADMNMFGYGWTESQSLATCQSTPTGRNRTCC